MRVRYQCSPHHVNDAFYPITSQIWHAARSGRRRASGSGAIGQVAGDDRAFGVGGEGHRAARRCPAVHPRRGAIPGVGNGPGGAEERTIAALMALFARLAKDAPVLVLLEDAHWIDPTSLDVF